MDIILSGIGSGIMFKLANSTVLVPEKIGSKKNSIKAPTEKTVEMVVIDD